VERLSPQAQEVEARGLIPEIKRGYRLHLRPDLPLEDRSFRHFSSFGATRLAPLFCQVVGGQKD